jgi:rhodanese-related sulfurtransferase
MSVLNEWSPAETQAALEKGEIVLIDVREPREFAAERIHGALLHPLSTFEPQGLPAGGARRVVLHCAGGKRSAAAVAACQAAGVEVDTHMAGGLMGWKSAGLPIIEIDPETGQVIDKSS